MEMTPAFETKLNLQTPKLYQYDVCPFCWKVKATLAYKKISYQTIEVHPLNKKEIAFSPDYRKVPIYIDSKGQQVNDSTPIMKHIDQEYPAKAIVAKDAVALEKQEKWMQWSNAYVRTIPPLIYKNLGDALKAFDYITHKGNFSWFQSRTIKYSGALVMIMVAKKTAKELNIVDPVAHFEAKIQEWANGLGEAVYMGGQSPDIADLSVFGMTMSMANLPAFELCKKNNRFWTWMTNMSKETQISLSA